jgi:1,4-alpha-glucan branching enzyme
MPSKRNGSSSNGHLKRVKLAYHMPEAKSVTVAGSFCDWQPDRIAMKKNKKGFWTTTLTLPPGRYEYRFVVDGEWLDDPNCTERTPNEFGWENCVIRV